MRGKYFVFMYPGYYPVGGLDDLQGQAYTLEEAIYFARGCYKADRSLVHLHIGFLNERGKLVKVYSAYAPDEFND